MKRIPLRLLKKSSAVLAALGAMPTVYAEVETVNPKLLLVDDSLEVTVWAKSPLFGNPTNMDMDAYGNMWVAEGVNYRRLNGRRPEGDRIMVVQDSNGDGKADSSHVFVQDKELVSPLGVSVFGNKILVAQPPNLIVYTDVDGDLKFDPKVDKREVLLDGFNGWNHDHSLHSTTAGPDGKWYINQGNCGAQFTDKDGKTFRIASSYSGGYKKGEWAYDPMTIAGKKSDDGKVWIGGFIARINPDGTQTEIVGHNLRNAYEHTMNSFGNIFHSDNDDPPACRNTYMLEFGNAGFSSADGKYSWESDRRPGQSIPVAQWRQENPGTQPAGDVYGSGSPTGVAFYENGALGKKFEGMYLACDAGRRDIMSYFPKPDGANFTMDRGIFLKANEVEEAYNFRPSDVEVGADGAIYVADWFDPRVGGHAALDDTMSGTIYRIAPKGFKPEFATDFDSLEGQIALLRSPSDNVRFLGFHLLKKRGAEALPALLEMMQDENPYVAARPIWLLPHLGDAGMKQCVSLLKDADDQVRITALMALKRADVDVMPYLADLSSDASAGVRREVLISLRDVPFADKVELLDSLYASWDGVDRTYLEALGSAMLGHEAAFWARQRKLVEAWDPKFAWLTWRLHPEVAAPELIERAVNKDLSDKERKFAIDTLAFINSPVAPESMLKLYALNAPEKEYVQMWLTTNLDGKKWDEWVDRDRVAKEANVAKPAPAVPIEHPAPPTERNIPKMEEITALAGDPVKGKAVAARCAVCHEIGDMGVNYGPGLTGWGQSRNKEQILNAILYPDRDIAHGFTASRVHLKNGGVIDGLVKSSKERSWHFVNNAGATAYLTVVTFGGQQQKVSWREIKEVKDTKKSLMFYPEQLGLTDPQDLADLTAYLQQLK
ncbi:PVC-type heme-binding CxxCH protein [Rubritalea marina]|uniref:PVC-type heme-binding CxxCH protein n=1 Tax=Rubritalea marina TaxID=361055 RepID=UPI000362CDCB|nr:PVC-type heme-binding CxxCH protein [Rubritalea marina]